jgi:hypothetical protein
MLNFDIDKVCYKDSCSEGIHFQIPILDAVIIIFAIAIVFFIRSYIDKLFA